MKASLFAFAILLLASANITDANEGVEDVTSKNTSNNTISASAPTTTSTATSASTTTSTTTTTAKTSATSTTTTTKTPATTVANSSSNSTGLGASTDGSTLVDKRRQVKSKSYSKASTLQHISKFSNICFISVLTVLSSLLLP